MKFVPTDLPDVVRIEPTIHGDERGFFMETWHAKRFTDAGIGVEFVQDNESMSQKNVLRGLHFQKPTYAQGKLVRVITGSVLDVAVDLRKESATYGHHFKHVLSAENKNQLYIPEGFAHGFLVLENNTIFSYKCTNYYHKESEDSILWDDPSLKINWGIKNPIISEKDKNAQLFANFKSPF